MKTFAYYYKSHKSPEMVGKVRALNIEGAVVKAAIIKQLSIDEFLDLFEIKEYERGTKKKN